MTFQEYKRKRLQNPEFRAEYERLQPEMSILRAMIDARERGNITQKELAEKTGIAQGDISRIENGKGNPSLKTLQKLADGLGMILELNFRPKTL